MTKVKTVFACQACGFESSKWLGRCPDCGEWNSFAEERQEVAAPAKGRGPMLAAPAGKPRPYDVVDVSEAERIPSGIGEFDRVLGGGIVPGSMVLIGGEPGIGKSTLLFLAKGHGVTIFLIGHVTKDGSLAGPKSLEHIVDTVLYFEGEKRQHNRIVRAVKNRFGAASELGVFEMTGAGLKPVPNPSALFLSERLEGTPGSAVVATLEGSRPVLVEIQALVSPTSFGNPRRTSIGLDPNRTTLL